MKTSFCKSCNSLFLANILEAGMPVLCPSCVPIYSIAKKVSNSNEVSPDVKAGASVVCGMILLVVGSIFLDKVIEHLKG